MFSRSHSFFSLGAFLLLLSSYALGGSFSAEVDRTEVELGDSVTLTLTIEGKAKGDPAIPSLSDVVIEQRNSQTSVSSEISSRGLSMVQRQTLTYEVAPGKAGSFKIPSLSLEVDGETLKTLPIEIKVSGAPSTPNAGKGHLNANGLGFERSVERKHLFVGESLPVTLLLSSRFDLQQKQLEQPMSPDWRVVPRGEDRGMNSSRGGQMIRQIEQNQIWVPGRSGTLKVEPARLTVIYIASTGGWLDLPQRYRRVLQSEALEFQVDPLPTGEPANFSGLVGKFSLSASLDTQKAKVGDNMRLNVSLQGTGLIEGWDAEKELHIQKGHEKDFKFYSGKPKLETMPDGEILQKKTFELALIPLRAGTVTLPPLEVSFFNPISKKYESSVVNLPAIQVEASDALGIGAQSSNGNGASSVASSSQTDENANGDKCYCSTATANAKNTDLADNTSLDKTQMQAAPTWRDRLQVWFFRHGMWLFALLQVFLAIPLVIEAFRLLKHWLYVRKNRLKNHSEVLELWQKYHAELKLSSADKVPEHILHSMLALAQRTAAYLRFLPERDQHSNRSIHSALETLRELLEAEKFGGQPSTPLALLEATDHLLRQWPGKTVKHREVEGETAAKIFSVWILFILCSLLCHTSAFATEASLNGEHPVSDALNNIAEKKVSAFQMAQLAQGFLSDGQEQGAKLAEHLGNWLSGYSLKPAWLTHSYFFSVTRFFLPETLIILAVLSAFIALGGYALSWKRQLSAQYVWSNRISWLIAIFVTVLAQDRLKHPNVIGAPLDDNVSVSLLPKISETESPILFALKKSDIVIKKSDDSGFCQIESDAGGTGWSLCEKFVFLPNL